jgi:hypothetical protein
VERFPALRLILRLGRIGALVVAVIVALAVALATWNSLGLLSLLIAPFVLAFTYFLAKSYVEIVQIITEMVH